MIDSAFDWQWLLWITREHSDGIERGVTYGTSRDTHFLHKCRELFIELLVSWIDQERRGWTFALFGVVQEMSLTLGLFHGKGRLACLSWCTLVALTSEMWLLMWRRLVICYLLCWGMLLVIVAEWLWLLIYSCIRGLPLICALLLMWYITLMWYTSRTIVSLFIKHLCLLSHGRWHIVADVTHSSTTASFPWIAITIRLSTTLTTFLNAGCLCSNTHHGWDLVLFIFNRCSSTTSTSNGWE